MNLRHVFSALLFSSFMMPALANDNAASVKPDPMSALLERIGQYSQDEARNNQAREAAFRKDLAEQKRLLAQVKEELKREQELAERLKKRFDANEKKLSEREEELRVNMGNLGEMFGVVRQVANDMSIALFDSLTSVQHPVRRADLNKLSDSKELPNIEELENLWYTMQQEMSINGRISAFDATVIGVDGQDEARHVTRIGVFNTLDKEGYIAFDNSLKQLRALGHQPSEASIARQFLTSKDDVALFALDPSRGTLLTMTLESPDLWARIQQGALVGYVIMVLGLIGFGVALWRLVFLNRIRRDMHAQQADLNHPRDDNPLGRVLLSYQSLPKPIDVDALEAKMNEAVLRELPPLERGQSIIKLFASIAPLLGLLGTVTGMIATFQAITNFGTGDPKLMASGISQALVTTVQGLVVAIPLLLAHNWVSSRSKNLVQLLDEQSAGLIASTLEQQTRKER